MEFDCVTNQAKNPKPNSTEFGTTQIIHGGVIRKTSPNMLQTVQGEILRLTIFEDGIETIIVDVDKDTFIRGLIDQYGLKPTPSRLSGN